MDCSAVKELLSAYYDDELSSDERTAVAEHLAGCQDCARELNGFRGLSAMAEGLTHPEAPAQLWDQLEGQLDASKASFQGANAWWTRWPLVENVPYVGLGLAVAAMILVTLGWVGYRTWLEQGSEQQFAAEFGEYIAEFQRDPYAAQQILLANYGGQAVDADQVVHTVGYRPAVADGLPAGYTVESSYVMKMPCCTCVQFLCKRSDGSSLAIFEHDDADPDWFGDRPEISATCNGKRCSLVQLDDRIAASWKRGDRHITVIGVRDTTEISELVAWLDEQRQISPR
jgi:hypothetical protein